MPRSVGEAAANGLESGFRLGMDIVQQRRNNDRQDRLDQQNTAGLAYTRDRQNSQDALHAIQLQEGDLAKEGKAMAESATPPTPEQQQDFTARAQGLQAAKRQHITKLVGHDVMGTQQAAKVDLQDIQQADDVTQLKPTQLTRAITVSTGRSPADFMRAPDGPAPIEVAGKDLIEGMQSGDTARMLNGLNVVYAPQLKNGIGTPGAQGGKIVGKQIINLVPDARSDKKDPKYIPMLRVYVNNGSPLRGPPEPGAPEGATGHYDAPLTEDRSSGPDAKVKSIGIKEAMDFVGNNLHVVELLNTPEAIGKLKEDQAAGQFDPQQYLGALAQMGIQASPKFTTKQTVIPQGAVLQSTTTDRSGNVVSERTIQGNDKTYAPNRSIETWTAKRQKLEDDHDAGKITENDYRLGVRKLDSNVNANKYTGDGAGAGGGTGKGAGLAEAKIQDKLTGRKIQLIEKEQRGIEKQKERLLSEYKADIHEASDRQRKAIKEKYDIALKGFDEKDKAFQERIDTLNEALDNAPAGLAQARPGGAGAKKPAPAAPAKPTSKAEYDKLPKNALYERDGNTYRKK